MNAINHTPSVIARWNPMDNQPLVFLSDDLPSDTWKAFVPGRGVIEVPNDVYKASEPLSDADTSVVVAEFKKFANVENVVVRKRAKYLKMRNIASRLGTTTEAVQKAFENAPAEQQKVIENLPTQNKRSIAAQRRHAQDSVQSTLATVKQLPSDATEEQRQQLAKDVAEAMTKLVLKFL